MKHDDDEPVWLLGQHNLVQISARHFYEPPGKESRWWRQLIAPTKSAIATIMWRHNTSRSWSLQLILPLLRIYEGITLHTTMATSTLPTLSHRFVYFFSSEAWCSQQLMVVHEIMSDSLPTCMPQIRSIPGLIEDSMVLFGNDGHMMRVTWSNSWCTQVDIALVKVPVNYFKKKLSKHVLKLGDGIETEAQLHNTCILVQQLQSADRLFGSKLLCIAWIFIMVWAALTHQESNGKLLHI